MANPIVITCREELAFILCEAAELEHLLMCEYLFAAFSLKEREDEGLSSERLAKIRRWERVITGVAVQEMLHLAQVCNLLTAIGAMPHFKRPNFPQRAKYYPPAVQLALMRFGEHTLRHFIYLERPEGIRGQDAPEFAVTGEAAPPATGDEVVPVPQDFQTVGQLYRAVEQGFRTLVDKYGEHQVFIGPLRVQATGDYFRWPELVPVTDLDSALKAIETIVEQGEGARGRWEDAHYGRFLQVLGEYLEIKRHDPKFHASRPVVPAWVRLPSDVEAGEIIADPLTAAVADLFNGSYEVILQTLVRFFVHERETPAELQTLADTAVDGMFLLISPLGRLLTTLPIGPHVPGQRAGPTFEIYRKGYVLPHREAAWLVLHERLLELADGCVRANGMCGADRDAVRTILAEVEDSARTLAAALAQHDAVQA